MKRCLIPLLALSAAAVAACGSSGSGSPVTAHQACSQLAAWERSDATGNVDSDRSLAATMARAPDPLASDYAAWMTAISGNGIGAAGAPAQAVNADCQRAGVQIFAVAAPSAPPTPAPSPTPPPATMLSQTETIVFSVTGTGDPDVTYGSDNNQNDAGTVSLPWQGTIQLDPSALYYAVDAQLQGYGSIQDTVSESITTTCSNGAVKTESFPMANGSASGGYAIASAEYVGGDPGNQYQAESDAGC
jgi:hypothetical protein